MQNGQSTCPQGAYSLVEIDANLPNRTVNAILSL